MTCGENYRIFKKLPLQFTIQLQRLIYVHSKSKMNTPKYLRVVFCYDLERKQLLSPERKLDWN